MREWSFSRPRAKTCWLPRPGPASSITSPVRRWHRSPERERLPLPIALDNLEDLCSARILSLAFVGLHAVKQQVPSLLGTAHCIGYTPVFVGLPSSPSRADHGPRQREIRLAVQCAANRPRGFRRVTSSTGVISMWSRQTRGARAPARAAASGGKTRDRANVRRGGVDGQAKATGDPGIGNTHDG